MTTTAADLRVISGADVQHLVPRMLRIPRCSGHASIHVCSAWHWYVVSTYRDAREAAEQAREEAVGVYGEGSQEWSDYMAATQMVTFKIWLINMAGERDE